MKIKANYLSIQELGQRSNQEDSIYPSLGERISGNDIFILCDGMGGHECGEVASQAVCKAMSSYLVANPNATLESALDVAYDALDEKDTHSVKKMGTTMTLVKLEDDRCIVAHIGDSRVYQIRPSEKKILYVTKDHSLVNDLIDCGELTPEEARSSSQKNVITRAMQPNQDRRSKADVAILTDVQDGDYFYMCSDGMLEVCDDQEIVNILSLNRPDADKIEILKSVTAENKDNHSAHLIHIVSCNNHRAIDSEKRTVQKRTLFYPIMLFLLISLGGIFWYLLH